MNETRIRAPELPEDLEWFNTDGPVKIADQRGKVVLLDFWTYCCVNCMHVLPDLAYLERKYPDDLMVIGIHSPKFPNERVGENLQKAINRYYIRHPVANDPGFQVWKRFGIRAWPSIIYIDPEGYVVGVLTGEGRRRQIDQMIQRSLQEAQKKGIRRPSPMPVRLRPEPETVLKFPGKVLATPNRIFVSDSGHNRIVEAMHNGRILRIYGSRTPGLLDGMGQEAAFTEPQGMSFSDNCLYVADTGNHAIRRIDVTTEEVLTIAGTGEQGRLREGSFQEPAAVPLNSPWDVVYLNGELYIAMAGAHQIWNMHLGTNTLGVYAGSGREDIIDSHPSGAAFAQPSGISLGEDLEPMLFVADAESSAIRAIRFRDGYVRTLIGKGLFEFGDRDGALEEARLQHPLGAAFDPQRKTLWIADTYNHKIRKLDLTPRTVSHIELNLPLQEPGGISVVGDSLWIANTNAHEVVRVDLAEGRAEVVELYQVDTD